MADKNNGTSGGVGFFGLLTIVFITLKLCGVINWSWMWVLSPILIPVTFLLVIILFAGGVYLITKKKNSS